MSSRSYYVPSPIEIARNRIAALQEQLDLVSGVKSQLAARMKLAATRTQERRVSAVGFGDMAIEASKGIDVHALSEAADTANAQNAQEVTAVVDFSGLFEADAAASELAGQSAADYLEGAKARAARLVAFSAADRQLVSRFMRRCDELAVRGGVAEDVRPFIDGDLEALCMRLGEAESAQRADVYLEYLALCAVAGEPVRDYTYAEMAAAVQRIKDDMAMRAFHQELAATFEDAMAEVGLESVGTVTLEGEQGRLVVDEDGGNCALFVAEDNGAFVFMTVAAQDVSSMTPDEQFAARDCASRLCSKKDRLVNEALARRGIVTEIKYEYPADLRFVERSEDFARYLQTTADQHHRDTTESAANVRRAE